MIPWTPNITWNDFTGVPKLDDHSDASISTSISGKINKVYNYPPALLINFMKPDSSWKRPNESYITEKREQWLLKHEQGHFDISEIHTRYALDSISNSWGTDTKNIEQILMYFSEKSRNHQDLYDSVTQHGKDTLTQLEWLQLIEKDLELKR